MKLVTAKLRSISEYSQSRKHNEPEMQGESKDDYVRRTWRSHLHVKDGQVFIPPMSFKNALAEAAKFMSLGIPGKGKATYTKNFEAGVLVLTPVFLGITPEQVEREDLFLPSDGRRGGGSRVMKYYPRISEWEGTVEFTVLDDTVLQSCSDNKAMTVFEKVLRGAGSFIGIGRWRPRNNGTYGRFEVADFAVSEI